MQTASGGPVPRLRIDKKRVTIPSGAGIRIEHITLMNEGAGVLKGTVTSDTPWVIITKPTFETPFILQYGFEIRPDKLVPGSSDQARIHFVTNGGNEQLLIKYIAHPEPSPILLIDEKQPHLCNLKRGDDISYDLMIRNAGKGPLTGRIESDVAWIEVKNKTIWTRDCQKVTIILKTSAIPPVLHPVGRIRVQTNGGTEEIEIGLHFRIGPGPKLVISPSHLHCSWNRRGIIEESCIIQNKGVGILRGTIPSPVNWMKVIPSIFPVETSTRITLRIDTRDLPEETLTVTLPVITNAGKDTIVIEVSPAKKRVIPPRKIRTRTRLTNRKRLITYDQNGRAYTLVSSGHSGGEGEIFHLINDSARCAKIFHPHRLTPEIGEKLKAMVRCPLPRDVKNRLTWPETLLSDLPRGERIIGYLMPRIPDSYSPAHMWYDQPTGETRCLAETIAMAAALSSIVAAVHKAGHCIGDLRENNLLVHPDGHLILIDTDSFQIRDIITGRVFQSHVGTGEYLPPEHLDGSFVNPGIDRQYGDRFALAVLVFRFLMQGAHPYQSKGPLVEDAPATTDKILRGYFAYESRISGVSPPGYAPPYSSVPAPIRELFHEVFVVGHKKPKARPDPSRWKSVLSSLMTSPKKKKPHIYLGLVDRRSGSPSKAETQNQISHPLSPLPGDGNLSGTKRVTLNQCIFHTSEETIWDTDLTGVLAVLKSNKQCAPRSGTYETVHRQKLPPSMVVPIARIHTEGDKGFGWLITGLDPHTYMQWHMVADSESRHKRWGDRFSFRHRIATCRNLTVALISATEYGIPRVKLTERSVFVGHDSSVRILHLPELNQEERYPTRTDDLPILIFRMLMDGYHPLHSHMRSEIEGYIQGTSGENTDIIRAQFQRIPSIRILPKPLKELIISWYTAGCVQSKQSEQKWFLILDEIFGSLISCPSDPDHWYHPGETRCPWCHPEEATVVSVTFVQPAIDLFRLETRPCVGYLTEGRSTEQRRVRQTDTTPRWTTIPLPARFIRWILLQPISPFILLTSGSNSGYLMIPFCQQVPQATGMLIAPCRGFQIRDIDPSDERDTHKESDVLSLLIHDMSIIDEMILVSSMERLKGEGICNELEDTLITPNQEPGFYPDQIMLLPFSFCDYTKPADQKTWFFHTIQNLLSQGYQHQGALRLRIKAVIQDIITPHKENTEKT
ncbi:MAG TPA: hypothetical protein VN372_02950 [Methanospirillum sp.]|nr:hypothetical protein [Methanospirillum sp.]